MNGAIGPITACVALCCGCHVVVPYDPQPTPDARSEVDAPHDAGAETLPSDDADAGVRWPETLSDWSRRRVLTITNPTPTALVEFPVLLRLDPSRIDFSVPRPGGEDVRFALPDGTLLSHEIERWTDVSAVVWVKILRIDARSDKSIYMYYDNPQAKDPQQRQEVWSDEFVGVWHLAEPLEAGVALNSSGSPSGSYVGQRVVADGGPFGDRSIRLKNKPDGEATVDLGSLAKPEHVTIEMVIKLDPESGLDTHIENWVHRTTTQWHVYRNGSRAVARLTTGSGYLVQTPLTTLPTTVADGSRWLYLAVTYDGTAIRTYFDGLLQDTTLGSGALTYGYKATILGPAEVWLSEVRVSQVARSEDWLRGQHDFMMTDKQISFGPEEPAR